ncbi:MAG: hypothetical protein J0H85_06070 [Sediminibacterium magnilacihabitans]|jgi:hypothetical protein|nr:hypothetical protein [Sediminibacterium magnilacihabitans]PQV61355.1 hypothetical protein CLV53_103208 [Sediminibacterium magnilacihabitans]
MKKNLFRKVLKYTLLILLFLSFGTLLVHIYLVTRVKPPDNNTLIMARIDIKQPIDQGDADKITNWMYGQKGVDHVLCNTQNGIVIFTFFPIKTSGDAIVANFKKSLHYKAERYLPTQEEMSTGCPVAASGSHKLYNYIKKIL